MLTSTNLQQNIKIYLYNSPYKIFFSHFGFVDVEIHEHDDQTFLLTLCLETSPATRSLELLSVQGFNSVQLLT